MRQRIAKLSAKAKLYTRTPALPLSEPKTVDGKRQINRQVKYEKWRKRRDGQVRGFKKPSASYGGETSGINDAIIRSRRL